MGNFNRDRRSGGGGGRDFNRPQMMHKTICSNCGKECEVPFKPNGSKPVFCRECFQKNRSSDSPRSDNNFPRRSNFENRGNDRTNNRPTEQPQYKQQFEALNAKLDKILNLLNTKEEVKKVKVSEPIQMPEAEVPIIKKKRVSKKTSKLVN